MLTLDYKRTAEYKEWVRAIKSDFPGMPAYLIDMAISYHKSNPRAYRDKVKPAEPTTPREYILNAVEVHDTLPAAEPVKLAEK